MAGRRLSDTICNYRALPTLTDKQRIINILEMKRKAQRGIIKIYTST